jgi:hypothetical protein
MTELQGSLLRRVDEGDPLLEVRPGINILIQLEQGVPELVMGLQEGRWRGLTLRQLVELFPQLPRRRQRPPGAIALT